MFIKAISIPNKKTGKVYLYFRLCESYRVGDAPRHRAILDLGKLEELPDRKDHKTLADCIECLVYKKDTLFPLTDSPKIKELAERFAQVIISKKLLDVSPSPSSCGKEEELRMSSTEADYETINLKSVRDECVREVGAEWLCKQTIDRLGIIECLRQLGWQERWIKIALIYLTGRAVFPASDRKSAEWLKQNSGALEVYGMETNEITRHHLYKVSRMLYKDKDKIENHLSQRTGEMFAIEDKILLYDLTNTYFEGEKKYSHKAKFGKSKEKRSDARLMALGLVTDKAGFIKHSQIYEGNIKDSKTLKQTLVALETYNENKPQSRKVVVMDAGIASEDNLEMLRARGYDYVCVSLSKMREYRVEEIEKRSRELKDKKGNKIFVRTTLPGKDEKTIWEIYNTIREIEATFRCLKTDLNMRPGFHQKDIYSESHIYGSILAYMIANSIRHPLKERGIHSDWRNIVRVMHSQKAVTTTMQTRTGKTIYLRKCSEPESAVREIYEALGYKDRPFWQKKSVLPKSEKPKTFPP